MISKSSGNRKFWKFMSIFLLAAFLYCGLHIFRDYGASSDEINQIEAGHITWKAICEYFGKPTTVFNNLPDLKNYYNRYYGQAATFPTVLIEALRGFQMDVSTVLRIRHLWNFCFYITGAICFAILIHNRYRREDVVFFSLLIYLATPRLFGDAFYNDRDVLLISLLWISLLSYELFRKRPHNLTAIICAFFFALTINTRYFGLVLILLPIISLLQMNRKQKLYTVLILILTFLFWYGMTPVFWGRFFSEFTAAFHLFSSGTQRTQETGGMAEILFFGRYFRENDLPFYYLPLWMFISTPLISQLFAGFGLIRSFRRDAEPIDHFMRTFLCLGTAAIMLIRPVMYNGWRHMYFLYVPFFWFAAYGITEILKSDRKFTLTLMSSLILVSVGWTSSCIASLHPYEYLYLNPLFQSKLEDFDRDYWRLSTRECLEWLAGQADEPVSVGEINENLDNALIALLPEPRSKIHVTHFNALHRYPADYLIFNYSESEGNDADFPLYSPVFAVDRDGVKLAEVFQREPEIHPSVTNITSLVSEIIDGDLSTQWRSDLPQNSNDTLIIEFTEPTSLHGLSILPGDDEREYPRSPEISISRDGETWTVLPITVTGLFDLTFSETETLWLQIRNTEASENYWSVREIYFYGNQTP